MNLSTLLAAWKLWRSIKDKAWVKAILAFLSKFAKNADTTPVLPRNHPDRKVTIEDITRSENNQV